MRCKNNNRMIEIIPLLLIGIFSFWLLISACHQTPEPVGESDDYMMPTISIINHGSLYITDEDIEQAKIDFPDFYGYLKDQYDNNGFFNTPEVKAHSWYMGTYSTVCIPMKLLLKFIGLKQSYAFCITNCFFYILALLFVYFKLKQPKKIVLLTLLLLMCNPALFYVTWLSAEVFIFSLVTISLVYFANGQHKQAALIISIAGTLNMTIMVFGMAIIADYFIKLYQTSKTVQGNKFLTGIIHNWKDIIKFALCFVPSIITPIYNYIHFKAFNLQILYGGFLDNANIFNRFLSYLFDLNFGILPYFSIGLILFFIFVVYGILKRNIEAWLYAFGLFGTIWAFSIMSNINCGMTGIARYNIWVIPIAIFFLTCNIDKIISNGCLKNISYSGLALSAVLCALILINDGPMFPNKTTHIKMTPIASFVLDHCPALYNPYIYTFEVRTAGRTAYSSITEPLIHINKNGYVRKALVLPENAQKLNECLTGDTQDMELLQAKIAEVRKRNGYQYLNFDSTTKLTVKNSYLLGEFRYALNNMQLCRGSYIKLELLVFNENCILDNNCIIIKPGGMQYGPYKYLDKGKYTVTIQGDNLDQLSYDVVYNIGKDSPSITEIKKNKNEIIYTFQLSKYVKTIEFRNFNNSKENISIYSVLIN